MQNATIVAKEAGVNKGNTDQVYGASRRKLGESKAPSTKSGARIEKLSVGEHGLPIRLAAGRHHLFHPLLLAVQHHVQDTITRYLDFSMN